MPFCDACVSCLDGTAELIETQIVNNTIGSGPSGNEEVLVYSHHASETDLLDAVKSGCQTCIALWRQASKEYQTIDFDRLADVLDDHASRAVSSSPCLLKCEISKQGDPPRMQVVHKCDVCADLRKASIPHAGIALPYTTSFYLIAHPEVADQQYLSGHADTETSLSNTGTSHVLSIVGKWIDGCSRHEACKDDESAPWLPTRLIDTQTPTGPAWFRVVTSADECSADDKYITLSHRWGDNHFLQLKPENFALLQAGQPISTLRWTFQDAIMVCRALGVRWLWIDSLCIIQGTSKMAKEDWQAEAPQMCQVYGRGLCNLSATETDNPDHGLFRDRDISTVARIRYRIKENSPLSEGLNSNETYDLVYSHPHSRFHRAPLIRRAWVLQERLLARRVLHFLEDRLVWECVTTTGSETYPGGIGLDHHSYIRPKALSRMLQHAGASTPEDVTHCEFCRLWMAWVADFTSCGITYASDKPAAIMGLGQKISELSQDQYLAGLWRQHLAHQLPWKVNYEPSEGTLDCKRDYPSWSWLSVDAIIGPTSHHKHTYKVLDVVSNSGLTTTEMLYDVVVLQGTLRRIRLTPAIKDLWQIWRPSTNSGEAGYTMLEDCGISPDYTRPGLPTRTIDNEHWMIYVGFWQSSTILTNFTHFWLLLHEVDRQQATYRRIGILTIYGPRRDEGHTPAEVKATATRQRNVDCTFTKHELDSLFLQFQRGDESVIHLV